MKQEPFLVAGSWRTWEDGWQVRHPYDDHLVANVARARPTDVDDAPLAAILAVSLMLRDLGEVGAADAIEQWEGGSHELNLYFAEPEINCGRKAWEHNHPIGGD